MALSVLFCGKIPPVFNFGIHKFPEVIGNFFHGAFGSVRIAGIYDSGGAALDKYGKVGLETADTVAVLRKTVLLRLQKIIQLCL